MSAGTVNSRMLPDGESECASGLWHQAQRKGQPVRKTVDRMPGPSWVENRLMNTRPAGLAGTCAQASRVSFRYWRAVMPTVALNWRQKVA